MTDAAVEQKAEEMFVVNGFSMDTICKVLDGQVSRKTLYNLRNKNKWDDKRRQRAVTTKNRRERLEAQIDRALDELEVVFDPKLVFAIGKLVAALKSSNTFDFTEDKKAKEDTKQSGISPDTWDKIEERLGLK